MEFEVGEVEEQVEQSTFMTVTQPKGKIVVSSTISPKVTIYFLKELYKDRVSPSHLRGLTPPEMSYFFP